MSLGKLKINGGSIISNINSRVASIVRYGAGITSWKKIELEEIDQKTRKMMMILGLIWLDDCVQVEVHSLEKYLNTSKEKILREVSRSRIIEKNKYERSKQEIHKEYQEKYKRKPLHRQFRKATEGVRGERSWD